MGYDFDRFPDNSIEEELICSICKCVLEDPVQAPECEHAFCRNCIEQWLATNSICPQDRLRLTKELLCGVPRIMKNLLARLDITCDYASEGCTKIVKLEHLRAHISDCEYNPTRPIRCEAGCGFSIPKNEAETHNCVKQLRNYIDECFHKWERERMLLFKLALSRRRTDTNPEDNFCEWYYKFPLARVTRWGALISTPDMELQQMVRQQLFEARCPVDLVNELMHNSHERQWPSGLNSLEVRQRSHAHYRHYILRKIGNQNAVLCLASENAHMNTDQVLDPGFIMIFAHGVEEHNDETTFLDTWSAMTSTSVETPRMNYPDSLQ